MIDLFWGLVINFIGMAFGIFIGWWIWKEPYLKDAREEKVKGK